MSDQWLSIVEYARKYNVSDMTVRRRIKTGKLQAILREGKYFIPTNSQFAPAAAQRSSTPLPAPVPVPAQNIVKSRPVSSPEAMRSYDQPAHTHHPQYVPQNISAQLREPAGSRSMVDANTLLAFCEGALKKFSDAEVRLEQQYQNKITQLEAQLQTRQVEITQLSQQVEDLQVLVKILERKSGKAD